MTRSDPILGVKAIAAALGVDEASALYRLKNGKVPGARKLGQQWALSWPEYREARKAELLAELQRLDSADAVGV